MAKTYSLGLLGWPVSHSLSPVLHHFWMKQHHIVGYYRLLAVEPNEFLDWMNNLRDKKLDGFNVTYPYKKDIIPFIDRLDPDAKMIGAVNTVKYDPKEGLKGWNTDGEGFVQTLPLSVRGKKVMILGAGATARAIALALNKRKVEELFIVCRQPEKIAPFCQYLSCATQIVPWDKRHEKLFELDLLVNATPIGMGSNNDQSPLDDLRSLPKHAVVADVVYHPIVTPLLHQALDLKLEVYVGVSLLIGQARLAFQHWFGIRPRANAQLLEKILCPQPEVKVEA